jgi:hypothetical protein
VLSARRLARRSPAHPSQRVDLEAVAMDIDDYIDYVLARGWETIAECDE